MPSPDLGRFPNEACAWAPDPESRRRSALHEAVRAAVGSALTDKQRAAVEGYFFEGLSQGDLAVRLGVTQQVVQKTLFGAVRDGRRVGGALAKLRTALAPLVTPARTGALEKASLPQAPARTGALERASRRERPMGAAEAS